MKNNRKDALCMKKHKVSNGLESNLMRPAMTPEARENQLIALAVDLAEKQLREGTASSQVIAHFLKLGSTKEKLEKEKLKKENDLMDAKTQNLKSADRAEEMYNEALKAFRGYSGQEETDENLY